MSGPRHAARPPRNGPLRRVREILVPGERAGRQLALIGIVDAIGTGMYYTGGALYFTLIVGLPAGVVGTGFALGGFAGLLLTVPIGVLADRVGAGRVLIGLQLLRALAYVAFCLVGNAAQFIAVAVLVGVTDGATPPNHQAVVGTMVAGEHRLDTLAKVRAVRNVGFGLGAMAATVAIGQGSRTGYLLLVAGNAVSFLVTALGLVRIGAARHRPARPAANRSAAGRAGAGSAGRWAVPPRYLGATVLNGVLSIHMTVLSLGLPLWVVTHTHVPAALLGPLVAGNTVLTVLLQAPLARPAGTLSGAVRCAGRAGLALAGCAVLLQLTGRISGTALACATVVLAVVLLTLAELWQAAAGWTISYELSPPAERGRYLAVFQLGTSLQAIAAPIAITALVLTTGTGWLVLGAVIFLCGAATPAVVGSRPKHLRSKPVEPPARTENSAVWPEIVNAR